MTDPRRAAVVAAAAAEIGPGDTPKYWRSCGIAPAPKPGTPTGHWCGAFWLFCLHQAELAQDVKWIPGSGFAIPQRLALTKAPEPGDGLYLDKPWQHYGVVESFENGVLTSIEGNTPTVQRRVRTDLRGIAFYSIAKFLNAGAGSVNKPPPPVNKPPPPVNRPPPTPPPPPPGAPGDGLLRGIDVSHHQAPGAISWAKLGETHRFVVARATYGTRPDETFREHIRRALDVGLTVGAYAFFRPGHEAAEQLDAFAAAVDAVGMGPGWLCPTLDVEQNEQHDGPISADRYAPAEEICRSWRERWGAAMVYTNPSMWAAIGSPGWLREHHLWIAHYGVPAPKTPFGLPWVLWQNLVAPLPGVFGSALDQNVARALPVLREPTLAPPLPIEQDLDERRADRDQTIRETEE